MNSESTQSTVSAILRSNDRGDRKDEDVVNRLVPLVYEELRRMAHFQLAREVGGITFETSGLVHEAYLKLVDQEEISRQGRGYFFGAAARAMRQVLVDAARRRRRLKRGSGERPLPLDETRLVLDGFAAEILDLEEAMEQLMAEFPRQAKVVECRFYAGLSVEETALALESSTRTVKRDWALARAFLFNALGSPC